MISHFFTAPRQTNYRSSVWTAAAASPKSCEGSFPAVALNRTKMAASENQAAIPANLRNFLIFFPPRTALLRSHRPKGCFAKTCLSGFKQNFIHGAYIITYSVGSQGANMQDCFSGFRFCGRPWRQGETSNAQSPPPVV